MTYPTDLLKRVSRSIDDTDPITGCQNGKLRTHHKDGHCYIKVGIKSMILHRVAYMLFKGDIPDGLQVNHLCGNAKCCSLQHLYVGTQKDNYRDAVRHGTATHLNYKNFKHLRH